MCGRRDREFGGQNVCSLNSTLDGASRLHGVGILCHIGRVRSSRAPSTAINFSRVWLARSYFRLNVLQCIRGGLWGCQSNRLPEPPNWISTSWASSIARSRGEIC